MSTRPKLNANDPYATHAETERETENPKLSVVNGLRLRVGYRAPLRDVPLWGAGVCR